MKTATYYNRQTKETYKIGGVKNLAMAHRLSNVACSRMNWNEDMFSEDVKVTVA